MLRLAGPGGVPGGREGGPGGGEGGPARQKQEVGAAGPSRFLCLPFTSSPPGRLTLLPWVPRGDARATRRG